jgi:integrase/recombinase XerD
LQYNGIIPENVNIKKVFVIDCPRCQLVNAMENKYCSKCSYPLKPEAFDEIKALENAKINSLEKKVEETNHKMIQIISLIQQIPSLSHIKPEALMHKKIDRI